MCTPQDQPNESAVLQNGSTVSPLVTLRDEHGGVGHIIEDDHCLVLLNEDAVTRKCFMATHWYREAVAAVRLLARDWIVEQQQIEFNAFQAVEKKNNEKH